MPTRDSSSADEGTFVPTENIAFRHELVLAIVQRDLPPDQRTQVLAELQRYASADVRGTARVQLEVLKLAGGRLDQLADLIAIARQDFRGVIGPAEYPRALQSSGDRVSPTEAERARNRVKDAAEYHGWLKGS